ncbi:hypothetical protein TGME49_270310 [Toxoplasma gondii ME49]|uniref:Carrier domain-containing protein n=2 Tax=Toxoplasma gondii TaxID=5811 RepID=S8F1E5_TOXGM|nr:hypothetical protein TGME49_270310 [Toxoplasma gondii ME49]EPT28412.1 hypothetical protein TGME49_270310 [Toxoplasma gondii ME49]|eukprot:XP_002365707.1 hypothetical protein TGME49_270310 [Toxoplasma gondii ME49]
MLFTLSSACTVKMEQLIRRVPSQSAFLPLIEKGRCMLSTARLSSIPAKGTAQGVWSPRHSQSTSQVEKTGKFFFSARGLASERKVLAADRVLSGLRASECVEATIGLRFPLCRLLSTTAATPPQGDSGKELPSSAANETTKQESPVVDTDINAVTNYIVGMCQKFLQKGEKVTPSSKLEELRTREDRLWDCLDTVEFVLDVEEIFDVTVPDEVADNFQTLQEIADFVVSERAKAGKFMKDQ